MDPSLAVAIVAVCVIVALLSLFSAFAVRDGNEAERAFLRERYGNQG